MFYDLTEVFERLYGKALFSGEYAGDVYALLDKPPKEPKSVAKQRAGGPKRTKKEPMSKLMETILAMPGMANMPKKKLREIVKQFKEDINGGA